MTATPKSVILAVVLFLGIIVLAVIAAEVVLVTTNNGDLPDTFIVLGSTALGALGGVLASTRTAPELAPGAVLETGGTTLTAAPAGDASNAPTRKQVQAALKEKAASTPSTITVPASASSSHFPAGTTVSIQTDSPLSWSVRPTAPSEPGGEFSTVDPADLGYDGGTTGGTEETPT